MSIKQTLLAIRALKMHAKYDSECGEYRVTFPYGEMPDDRREAVACYTNDAQDALDTARAMRAAVERKAA